MANYYKLGTDSKVTNEISKDLYDRCQFDIRPKHLSKLYYTAIAAARKVINTSPEYRNKVFMLRGNKSVNLYIFREGKKMKCGNWRYTYCRPDVCNDDIIDAYEDYTFIKAYDDILLEKFGGKVVKKGCIDKVLLSSVYYFAVETTRLRNLHKRFHFGFMDQYDKYVRRLDEWIPGKTVLIKFLAADGVIE